MNRTVALLLMPALLASCSGEPQRSRNPPPAGEVQQAPAVPRTRPTIDPKSSEAAELLVRGFARLINQGKLGDAYMLLGPNAPPRGEFEQQWTRYTHLMVTSGRAGVQDGAAGSIYVSVPLTLTGEIQGKQVRRSATAVLRRVNDVPGSTEAQRRWHIQRIDFSSAG